MRRQLDLLATTSIDFDPGFADLRRSELADGAWVDHVAGWVRGHDQLFDELERSLTWRSETRRMYDHVVATPRLLASIPAADVCNGILDAMRTCLSRRYAEDFVRVTAALYRDGNDSVAWHGDTTARDMVRATVAKGSPTEVGICGGGAATFAPAVVSS